MGLTDNELMYSDTLLHTFLFLDISTIINSCFLVSKQFNSIAKSNPIWEIIYIKWLLGYENDYWWRFDHDGFINSFKLSNDDQEREDSGEDDWFRKCMELLECLPRQIDLSYESYSSEFMYELNNRDAKAESHLKLATILTILYESYNFSYFRDDVVIGLRGYLNESEEEIVCPLVTFCIMILNGSYSDLPLNQHTENSNLCVAPYVSGNMKWTDFHMDIKDCCYFKVMDPYGSYDPVNGTLYFSSESDEGGFSWCPRFFNSGGRYYISRIVASSIGPSTIKVEKTQDVDYY